ncbi:hypothetical protein [Saccharopolyspora shandongensis]|uniref:hypothetical protein n=1 Tax=Saccharopolyspora shandongensis TaxID=418495 RepID=UPI0033CD7500
MYLDVCEFGFENRGRRFFELLIALRLDGFTLELFGDSRAPTAIAYTFHWAGWVDRVLIRSFDRVAAARIPAGDDVNAPETVAWAYLGYDVGMALHALQALLTLPHPDHPDAPASTTPAPRDLHVPVGDRVPSTTRPPSPLGQMRRVCRLTYDLSTAGASSALR